MKKRPIKVSNHALLRYLERVGGFEIEKLRRSIEAEIQAKAPEGASAIILDGQRYVIRDVLDVRVVVTVMPHDWPNGGAAPVK